MKKENFETKTANVKRHLLSGKSITSWEAITLYRCTRLSAVIFNLKNNHGLNIASETVTEDGVHYSVYYLVADASIKEEIGALLKRGGFVTKEVAEQMFDCQYLDVVIRELCEDGLKIVGETIHPLCGKAFKRYCVK